jgi:hypothetical protein
MLTGAAGPKEGNFAAFGLTVWHVLEFAMPMPISGQRFRFTTWQIAGAPAQHGVYVLWCGENAIHIGAARGEATLRSCLQDHYTRRTPPHDASHFSWEISPDPRRREAELVAELGAHLPRRLPTD